MDCYLFNWFLSGFLLRYWWREVMRFGWILAAYKFVGGQTCSFRRTEMFRRWRVWVGRIVNGMIPWRQWSFACNVQLFRVMRLVNHLIFGEIDCEENIVSISQWWRFSMNSMRTFSSIRWCFVEWFRCFSCEATGLVCRIFLVSDVR